MKKLTLSADPEVIEQAKRIADETGTSTAPTPNGETQLRSTSLAYANVALVTAPGDR